LSSIVLLILALLVGCGKASGTITGTVTFKGEPVQNGTIAAMSKSGQVVSSSIKDGTFKLDEVPLGESRVAIQSSPPPPPFRSPPKPGEPTPPPPPTPPPFVPLPERYTKVETSGLTIDVKAGSQAKDFELRE
jgi:hypothetical protein